MCDDQLDLFIDESYCIPMALTSQLTWHQHSWHTTPLISNQSDLQLVSLVLTFGRAQNCSLEAAGSYIDTHDSSHLYKDTVDIKVHTHFPFERISFWKELQSALCHPYLDMLQNDSNLQL